MALKNDTGFDKSTFLMYSILPALVIAVVAALYFFFNNKGVVAQNTQPVSGEAAELQADPSVDYDAPLEAPNATDPYNGLSAMAVGEYKGETPEILTILDKMGGYKQDKSKSAADTVYVIYDPRCPYCKSLYDKLKETDLDGKGITIKWMPTVALGADENGVKRASYGLHVDNDADFGKSMDMNQAVNHTVSDKDALQLEENLAFLFEASRQTFGDDHPKSVPATFYLDKKTGEPQMMYGASSDEVFRVIFGE